jgi:anti-sigma factor RsiW
MDSHLSDAQLFEALLGNSSPRVKAHLASCPECRARLERLRSLTAAFRDSAHTQAERPEAFWARQRSVAAARISGRPVGPLAWAAAIAAAVLAAMLIQEPRPVVPVTPATDPDQALLVSVEQAVNRRVPQALAPAALLTQEITRNVKPAVPNRQSKGESQ